MTLIPLSDFRTACPHKWVEVREYGVVAERCKHCSVLRSPRWHSDAERPPLPAIFNTHQGALR